MNIHEILEDNYIIGSNEDYGLIVTVNGAYTQIWVGDGDDYEAREAIHMDMDLDKYPFSDVIEYALKQADGKITDEMNDTADEDDELMDYGGIFPIE